MVDYTVPDIIHDMVDLYIRHRTPFVMGTTGGDRARIAAEVGAAGLYAVIAPQMGKQVVAFQAMMQLMADSFPGAFSGYNLNVGVGVLGGGVAGRWWAAADGGVVWIC